jgi:hypothetical protein
MRATDLRDTLTVNDNEGEPELVFEPIPPLNRHRRRPRDHDKIDSPPQQHLAHDQASLDRLAEADIVRDQEVDPGQPERLPERQ